MNAAAPDDASGRRIWLRDIALSSVAAGFVTVLVGFTSSAVIVFQAAQALGASAAETASWLWALGIGMGVTCIGLSLRWRIPVVTAWSTPGAAMLIASNAGVPLSDAIGAFVLVAALTAIVGFSGVFERGMRRVPLTLASGLLGGVLLRFGMDVFVSMRAQMAMTLAMFVVYLCGRRWFPRYAVLATLLVGMAIAGGSGLLHLDDVELRIARPIFTMPSLSFAAVFGIALPLFVVTMASQNIPGVAVLRASGYAPPVSSTIGWIGIANTLLAPFGAYSLCMAAITAAICSGREAHPEPSKRYVASVFAGIFYLFTGVFGATVAALFAAFPKELVMAIAGLALFGTIGNSLAVALREDRDREAALITFLVTASGFSLGGIGSAFWGLIAGGIALLLRPRAR
ncbi:MAG: benzoate/H(+) symporter BenE family transporter [Xanthomonadales bacterium]|nr:benzoate/H(+) symporter BenE family transporter [Xanthomonadales bacterium]